MVACQ
jgi:hypothetical protein